MESNIVKKEECVGQKENFISVNKIDTRGFSENTLGYCYNQGSGKMLYRPYRINTMSVEGYFELIQLSLNEGVDVDEIEDRINKQSPVYSPGAYSIPFGNEGANYYRQISEIRGTDLLLVELDRHTLDIKELCCFDYSVIKDYVNIRRGQDE